MNKDIYYFWLSKAGHIAKIKHDFLVNAYGNLEEAFLSVKKGRFLPIKGMGENQYERLQNVADYQKLSEEFDRMKENGIGFLSYFSSSYPERLKNIYSPPISLYYKGKLPSRKEKMIAVVGSRAASEKGLYYASKMARELSENGVGIVSGMALGIDSAAHMGCLEGSSTTIAVLGSGVDICYPKLNFSLYLKLIEKGCILSEFSPGTLPYKTNFPLRNRIISGLSDGVLVVEAREKSGSLITANQGLEQGKNIYAMPGEAEFPLSEGTNRLIQLGAKLVVKAQDILEDFDYSYPGFRLALRREEELEGMDRLVYSVMDTEPKHISAITEDTGLSGAELFFILFKLEGEGYVKRVGFEYYVAVI